MIGTVSIGINSVGVDDEDDDVAGGYTLTAEAGSFTLSGQAAGLVAARKLSADAGAFALSGQTVALRADRLLTASQGAFTLTGQDADLIAPNYTLTADAGSFTLTGQDATLTASAQEVSGGGAWIPQKGRSFYLPPEPIKRKRKPEPDPEPEPIPPDVDRAMRIHTLSRMDAEIKVLLDLQAQQEAIAEVQRLQDEDDAIAILLLLAA